MNDSTRIPLCEEVALDLPALADGGLEPSRRASVREHLAHCARCTRELRDFERISSLLASEPEPTLEEVGQARLALRRAMVRGATTQSPRRVQRRRVARSVLVRAATFLLSTALLTTLARQTALGVSVQGPANGGIAVAAADSQDSVLAWVRSVRSAARSRIDPWLPEWSVPSLREMLPAREESGS